MIKETHSYRFCSHCGGSGYKVRTFRGEKMKNVCSVCRGSGKEKITHRTEVSLEEALQEVKNDL